MFSWSYFKRSISDNLHSHNYFGATETPHALENLELHPPLERARVVHDFRTIGAKWTACFLFKEDKVFFGEERSLYSNTITYTNNGKSVSFLGKQVGREKFGKLVMEL
jgi:hypothetical protein